MHPFWRTIVEDTYNKRDWFRRAAIMDIASTIWAADIFMGVVDTSTVHFAKWFEEKCIVSLE